MQSSNSDLHSNQPGSLLTAIGWDEARAAQLAALADPALAPARIARVDGASSLLITARGQRRGESSSSLFFDSADGTSLPAVGDWVAVRPRPSHSSDSIEAVLPRTSQLVRTRRVMDSAAETQIVAANLDAVFIVHAANNFNLRRLEREAAQVAASGAQPVAVLNKADLYADIAGAVADVEMALPGTPVHAVSGFTGAGVDALRAYTASSRTVAFIGASGVGKSTLTNRLLGEQVMDTGAVREDDQRGRHTTTARNLLPLPGGGALIDTPGMRSFGLAGAGDGVDEVFSDIAALAAQCRFHDCTHGNEPGCAVQEAIDTGELDDGRFRSYIKLQKELAFIESKSDMSLRAARNDRWKQINKGMKKRLQARERYGRPG